MPKIPKSKRNARQQVRQQQVRDKAKVLRRPSRDDIARMFLWQTIVGVLKRRSDARAVLDKMREEIVDALTQQGFNESESLDVFDDLVRKYSDGLFPFRPKRHLGDKADEPAS